VHNDATWRIRLNRKCAAAMRPYVKLLWPLFPYCFMVIVQCGRFPRLRICDTGTWRVINWIIIIKRLLSAVRLVFRFVTEIYKSVHVRDWIIVIELWTSQLCMLKLRCFDLMRNCCTKCCTTNPQQIEVRLTEFEQQGSWAAYSVLLLAKNYVSSVCEKKQNMTLFLAKNPDALIHKHTDKSIL